VLGKPLVAGHTQAGLSGMNLSWPSKAKLMNIHVILKLIVQRLKKWMAIGYLWPVVFFFQFCDVAEVVIIHKRIFLAKSGW